MRGLRIILIVCGLVQITQAYDIAQVKADLRPIRLAEPFHATPAISAYFDFYGLSPTNTLHWFGTVESEGHALAAHVFMPPEPKATVFLVHGFLDHTATLSKLIEASLREGFAVVSWDLPGHGLSTGNRTETGDFSTGARQLEDVAGLTKDLFPRPHHLIAHSTGASISMEYLFSAETNRFDQIVLLAPLVRHQHWGWGKFGYRIADPFTQQIARKEKDNSSDKDYLEFARNDPLGMDYVSFAYLEELYAWENRFLNYAPIQQPVLIIQGDQDDVVLWKYNMEFLEKKIPYATVEIIPGARHQLVNESPALRQQVFDMIFNWLQPQECDE